MSKKVGLFWFRKDLRLQDNITLEELKKNCDEILFVYLGNRQHDEWDEVFSLSHSELIGPHKQRFVDEALQDIDSQLSVSGNSLLKIDMQAYTKTYLSDTHSQTLAETRVDIISHMAKNHYISSIGVEWHSGVNEQKELMLLEKALSTSNASVDLIALNSSLLYNEEAFPFSIENLPQNFSPFRRKVEKYSEVAALPMQEHRVPPQPSTIEVVSSVLLPSSSTYSTYSGSSLTEGKTWHGGESAALQQLQYYLWETDCIARYKETRNGLIGWDFSSKLSAWLAHGCISPRRVYAELKRYEAERTANDSTYWLFFELLWREFFHWHLVKYQATLFHFTGVQQQAPKTHFAKAKIESWIKGETGYEIVDACMRQLAETGFMSNRGRQLVASCFVHELEQDWRYGAAYFEYQLIDFDVASNYGNWQYLAGVGADPRGHRQFNLEKQTQTYDPKRSFIQHFLG